MGVLRNVPLTFYPKAPTNLGHCCSRGSNSRLEAVIGALSLAQANKLSPT